MRAACWSVTRWSRPPSPGPRRHRRRSAERVVVSGNPLDDAPGLHVYRWTRDDGFVALTDGLGVHTAAVGGDTIVLRSAVVDEPGARWRLPSTATTLTSLTRAAARATQRASDPPPRRRARPPPSCSPTTTTARRCPCCSTRTAARTHSVSSALAQRVLRVAVVRRPGLRRRRRRRTRHAGSGHRATNAPSRRPRVRRARRPGRRHSTTAAERHPELDLGRVAIRGWSFGGYLSALAVLRRPDVFHAAIAGAPVTEWRLYDTCYTERYLGDPNEQPEVYDANSLIPLAPDLERPLLLIHGLADDNVVAAHTLQLSSALLAAGKPARGAAARRRDAHDPAGGRRREPPAAPARLPPPQPRLRRPPRASRDPAECGRTGAVVLVWVH